MNFVEAISSGFSNYVKFSGRAIRSEYWYWILFIFAGYVVAGIIDYLLGLGFIFGLFALAIVLPTLAVTVRRLHDLDRSGWWIFLSLIPTDGWARAAA
jgi:uncharacterized membrane protein YhaH (DUF805 family)